MPRSPLTMLVTMLLDGSALIDGAALIRLQVRSHLMYIPHGIDRWHCLDKVTGQIPSDVYTTWDR